VTLGMLYVTVRRYSRVELMVESWLSYWTVMRQK